MNKSNDRTDRDLLTRTIVCVELAATFIGQLSDERNRDIVARACAILLDKVRTQHRFFDKWVARTEGTKRPDCRRSYSAQTTEAESPELFERYVVNHEPIAVTDGRRAGSVITYDKPKPVKPLNAFDELMREQREFAARRTEESCDSK